MATTYKLVSVQSGCCFVVCTFLQTVLHNSFTLPNLVSITRSPKTRQHVQFNSKGLLSCVDGTCGGSFHGLGLGAAAHTLDSLWVAVGRRAPGLARGRCLSQCGRGPADTVDTLLHRGVEITCYTLA